MYCFNWLNSQHVKLRQTMLCVGRSTPGWTFTVPCSCVTHPTLSWSLNTPTTFWVFDSHCLVITTSNIYPQSLTHCTPQSFQPSSCLLPKTPPPFPTSSIVLQPHCGEVITHNAPVYPADLAAIWDQTSNVVILSGDGYHTQAPLLSETDVWNTLRFHMILYL